MKIIYRIAVLLLTSFLIAPISAFADSKTANCNQTTILSYGSVWTSCNQNSGTYQIYALSNGSNQYAFINMVLGNVTVGSVTSQNGVQNSRTLYLGQPVSHYHSASSGPLTK